MEKERKVNIFIMAAFNNPFNKISQKLTEKIFPLTRTRGDNPNLLMPPHTVTAGANFGTIF